MTNRRPNSSECADVAQAVGRFVANPGVQGAARLEATLFAKGGVARLFSLEDAVSRAWPGEVAKELVWARRDLEKGVAELRLRAFDAAGAVLAQARYGVATLKRADAGHE
jgi:hypothetical protein